MKSLVTWVGGILVVSVLAVAAVITVSTAEPQTTVRDPLRRPAALPLTGLPVLVWTPGGLPPHLGAAARAAPGTRQVAEVNGDFAWLDAWAGAGAEPVTTRPGSAIPLDVAAVDPAELLPFVGGPDREVLAAMGSDGLVLSRTGATLRGVGPGGWLRFGQTTLPVRGVVADAAIGGHEVVVSKQTGALIGVTQPRYLLVRLANGTEVEHLERTLRKSLPAGRPLRVRLPGPGTFLREGEVTVPPGSLKLLFGEFRATRARGGALILDRDWVDRNIREQTLPIVGAVKCHRAVFPQLQAATREIVESGLADRIHRGDFGGCYFPRFLNWDPEAGISHHTWGAAVDFNVSENLYGTAGRMDPRVVDIFERWGFEWGGRWLVPDPMHFELVRFVTPAG